MKSYVEDIIRLLLMKEQALTIQEISTALHVSQKTVWNKINSKEMIDFLGNEVQLVKKMNVGIYLSASQSGLLNLKKKIDGFPLIETKDDEYRRNRLLIELVKSNAAISIQDFAYLLNVTRKVILLDLDVIKDELTKYHLCIEKRQNVGVIIVGEELNLRQFLEYIILKQSVYYKSQHHKNTTFDEGVSAVLHCIGLGEFMDNAVAMVKRIEKEFVGQFTDEGNKEITIQILISHYRTKRGWKIGSINEDPFEMNNHFQVFKEMFERYHMPMDAYDYMYLWRRCITNRFVTSKEQEVDEKFLQLARELLASVLDLQDNEELSYLIHNLAFHLHQAVKRSNIGIKVHNPILHKIKQKYGKFYTMVLTNVHRFEGLYHISLNEDEIGFITVYICAIYEKSKHNQYYSVLLVSDEGVGQRQLLTLQIMNNFHNLLIQDTSNSLNVTDEKLDACDFIISTCSTMIKPQFKEKFIRVSSILDNDDLDSITACILRTKGVNGSNTLGNSMVQSVAFKYFESNVNSREEICKTYLQMAEQFGYTDKAYMESVFEREKRASTSIGKGIAIPHGDDVHIIRPAVFVVRNAKPIIWGQEQVDIILFLILKFTSIHENKQFFIRLYECMEKSELIRNINDEVTLEELKNYILEGEEK